MVATTSGAGQGAWLECSKAGQGAWFECSKVRVQSVQ